MSHWQAKLSRKEKTNEKSRATGAREQGQTAVHMEQRLLFSGPRQKLEATVDSEDKRNVLRGKWFFLLHQNIDFSYGC